MSMVGYDPEFLAELRSRAERLSLAEAENKRINLTGQEIVRHHSIA